MRATHRASVGSSSSRNPSASAAGCRRRCLTRLVWTPALGLAASWWAASCPAHVSPRRFGLPVTPVIMHAYVCMGPLQQLNPWCKGFACTRGRQGAMREWRTGSKLEYRRPPIRPEHEGAHADWRLLAGRLDQVSAAWCRAPTTDAPVAVSLPVEARLGSRRHAALAACSLIAMCKGVWASRIIAGRSAVLQWVDVCVRHVLTVKWLPQAAPDVPG